MGHVERVQPKHTDVWVGKRVAYAGTTQYRDLLEDVMQSDGYQGELVHVAHYFNVFGRNNVEEALTALDRLGADKPDVLVIYLPGTDVLGEGRGLDVLVPFVEELKKRGIQPVIFDTEKQELLDAGAVMGEWGARMPEQLAVIRRGLTSHAEKVNKSAVNVAGR